MGLTSIGQQKPTSPNDPRGNDPRGNDPRGNDPRANDPGKPRTVDLCPARTQDAMNRKRRTILSKSEARVAAAKPSDEAVAAARLAIERLEMQSMSRIVAGADGWI